MTTVAGRTVVEAATPYATGSTAEAATTRERAAGGPPAAAHLGWKSPALPVLLLTGDIRATATTATIFLLLAQRNPTFFVIWHNLVAVGGNKQ